MAVQNGQSANEATFNNAFGSKSSSNEFTGIQSFKHSGSGGNIDNVQKLLNNFLTSLGYSSESDANRDVYDEVVSNLYAIANGQNRKVAIKNLDAKLKEIHNRTTTLEGSIPVSKYDATVDPTATDDADAGYLIGSHWFNDTTKGMFVCTDNTTGAAVWEQVGNKDEITVNATYFGDKDTDGTWRITADSGNLRVEVRVAGVWTTKDEYRA